MRYLKSLSLSVAAFLAVIMFARDSAISAENNVINQTTIRALKDSMKSVKDDIKELKDYVKSIDSQVKNASPKSPTSQNVQGLGSSQTTSIAIATLSLLLSVATIITIAQLKKKKTTVNDDPRFRSYADKVNERIATLESKIEMVDHTCSDSKNKYNDLSAKVEKAMSAANFEQKSSSPPLNVTIQRFTAKTFFLSAPQKDGTFNISSESSTFRDDASMYRFDEYEQNNATFIVADKREAIQRLIASAETCILPVCVEKNAYDQNATSIVTDKPGIAVRENDKWRVTTKAEIRYV
jgi:hypothetical protein